MQRQPKNCSIQSMSKAELSFSFSVVFLATLFFAFCNSAALPEETELKAKDVNSNPVSTEETEDLETDGVFNADFSQETEALKSRDETEPAETEDKTNLAEDKEITLVKKNDWAEDDDEEAEDDDYFDSETTMEMRDEEPGTNIEEMNDWAEDDGDNINDGDDEAAEEDDDDDDDDDSDFPEDTAMELRDDTGTDGAEETNDVVEDDDFVEGQDENDESA